MSVDRGADVDASADGARTGACQLRICLAASGGGHLRQLIDLKPVWAAEEHFFLTEDTALGRSIGEQYRTHFLPHFAWGQFRLGAPFRMLAGAAASFVRSGRIMLRERPDVVITTGAGAVFFCVLWARLLGAHAIVVESFARFEKPSLFGRMAAPLANEFIIQSARLQAFYPKARLFDPFRTIETPAPAKEPLLFATVGATLPFNRLVDTVAAAKADGLIPEKVIVQTGIGGRRPANVESSETFSFDQIQDMLREASIVVCHGGTGSLITALREGCHVIAMPRLSTLGEHYDDHQSEITAAFEKRGLLMVARSEGDFRLALAQIRSRERRRATTDPRELADHLQNVLDRLRGKPRLARRAHGQAATAS